MGHKRTKPKAKPKIEYPPVTTRKWIPPEKRKKKVVAKPPPYPPQLTQKLAISSLLKFWHDYKIVNDCAVLLGDISMFNNRFSFMTNGHQGHAICIVCALYSRLCPSYHWCSKTLDEIVIVGDRFYQRSVRMQKCAQQPLTIEQLNKDVFIHSHKITICLKGQRYQGLIFKDLETNSKDYLANIIKCFFECHECGMLYTESTPKRYFSIWKFRNGYFLFDPADHDEMCWPVRRPMLGKGHTFVVRFRTTDRLVQVLQRQLPPTNIEFELLPIVIERIVFVNTRYPACLVENCEEIEPVMKELLQKEAEGRTCLSKVAKIVDQPISEEEPEIDDMDDAEPDEQEGGGAAAGGETVVADEDAEAGEDGSKPKKFKKKAIVEKPRVESVTYFNYIVPDRIGIMLAETHQEDPEFDRCFSMKDFCMGLGALVHLRENKAKYWTTRIVTNALRLGFRICIESLILIQPDRNLKIKNLVRKVELNEKHYTPVIEQYGAIGRLQSLDNAILDLLPALREVFSEFDTVILNGPLVVALWREEGLYYMFDPHERDPNGFAIVKEIQIGSVMEAVDFISGVACLTWFTDLRDLVDMYMANVERDKRRETFIISTVDVKDYVELPDHWCNFRAICPEKWILQGSFAQGDVKFPKDSRNTQCTANCLIAIVFHHMTKVDNWTTETIDDILEEGDRYFHQCVDALKKKEKFISPMLLVSELLTDFVMQDRLVCVDVSECVVNGVITIPEEFRKVWNLHKGFSEYFRDNDFAILTCRGISVAVFKSSGAYFYFDSHDRNNFGYSITHGKACVQRFVDLKMLCQVIMGNLGPDVKMAVYNISKVEVKIYEPIPPGEQPDEDDSTYKSEVSDDEEEANLIDTLVVERPLFNFTKLTKKRAILRSSFYQGKEDVFDVAAGKQTVANLMAAPSMARVFVPNEWTVDILDDVLRVGQKIYDASMQEFYKQKNKKELEQAGMDEETEDETDDITLENVVKEFKIGVNKFTVEFEKVSEGMITVDGQALADAVKTFFAEEPANGEEDDHRELVLQSDAFDVVMWKSGTLYYLFDPNCRDEKGMCYGTDEWSEIMPDSEVPDYDFPEDDVGQQAEEEADEVYEEREGADEMDDIRQFIEQEWKEYGFVEEEQSAEPLPPPKHPQDHWDQMAKDNGRACVIWFTKPKFLIRHLIANAPPRFRDEMEFVLSRMVLRNVPDVKEVYDPAAGPKPDTVAGDWYDWREITHGQWILRGSMHERNMIFPETNRGLQSHANCLLALAYGYIYAMSQFNKFTVDQILKYGDRLYTSTKKVRRKELEALPDLQLTAEEIDEVLGRERYTIENLIKTFCVGEESVAVKVNEEVITGEVHAMDVEDEFDVLRGLQAFFARGGNRLGVLTSKNQTVAVFRMGLFYYMFDSHERGPHGMVSPNGVACCTRFQELNPLVALYLANVPECGKNFFSIYEVNVGAATCMKIVKEEMRRVDDPLKITGFEPVVPGKMIIRGTISQEDPKFGRGSNAQSAPVACVALTMTLLHSTEFWTKIIVDEIVNIGDEIYAKYIDRCDVAFNPWEEKLTLALSPKDFKIGKNKVNYELRTTDQSGIIDIKDPTTLNLRQGIENFFEENSHGVLETDLLTVAIWQEDIGEPVDYFYMFDPNPRSSSGQPVEEGGVAAVLKFISPKIMADHIISLVASDAQGRFLITPIEIVIERDGKKIKKTKKYGLHKGKKEGESPHSKKLGRFAFYTLPTGEMAVLRGTKSQAHRCYSQTSRGRQDVPNCIVAYVMDKLIPISRWTYKNIDMILDMGDLLYKDSYMVYNPKEEKISLETLIRDVVIKDIRVKISVGAPVLTAPFSRRLLGEALVACFNLKNFCIVLLDQWAVAIFKKCETYYLFDPTDVDLHGNRIERCGSATVMRFDDIDKLIEIFMRNMDARPMGNEVFRIIIAAVKQIEKIPVGATFDEDDHMGNAVIPEVGSQPNCDKVLFGNTKSIRKKHRDV